MASELKILEDRLRRDLAPKPNFLETVDEIPAGSTIYINTPDNAMYKTPIASWVLDKDSLFIGLDIDPNTAHWLIKTRNSKTKKEEVHDTGIVATGPVGSIGPTGIRGMIGPTGEQGIEGKSAYELAVEAGYSGTEAQWLASLIGPTGETGAIGPTGETGEIGPTGASGLDGENGAAGPTGALGPVGPTGEAGAIGPTGKTGEVGPTGAQGEQGPTGAAGQDGRSANIKGSLPDTSYLPYPDVEPIPVLGDSYIIDNHLWIYTNSTATEAIRGFIDVGIFTVIGPTGANGRDGIDGVDGNDGLQGPTGATGVNGYTPYIGDNGYWYINGNCLDVPANGNIGPTGPQGPVGPTGERGVTGVSLYADENAPDNSRGKVGDSYIDIRENYWDYYIKELRNNVEVWIHKAKIKAKDGDSAYAIALAHGYRGTESEWLDSLKGDTGESAYEAAKRLDPTIPSEAFWLNSLHGPTGITGTTGPTGATGAQGPTGAIGLQGPTGIEGTQGPTGDIGPTGPQGNVGPTGAASTVPGPQGPTGLAGPTGPQGEPGIQGERGEKGPQGERGPAGIRGDQGPQGLTGPTGASGQDGEDGVDGKTAAIKYENSETIYYTDADGLITLPEIITSMDPLYTGYYTRKGDQSIETGMRSILRLDTLAAKYSKLIIIGHHENNYDASGTGTSNPVETARLTVASFPPSAVKDNKTFGFTADGTHYAWFYKYAQGGVNYLGIDGGEEDFVKKTFTTTEIIGILK